MPCMKYETILTVPTNDVIKCYEKCVMWTCDENPAKRYF